MSRRLRESVLFWPALTLVVLGLLNALINRGFFSLVFRDGHVFGSVVDIGARSAPLIFMALGMTVVIATGGIDLSVGSVAAVAASVGAVCLNNQTGTFVAISCALAAAVAIGLWNGFLVAVVGLQPIIATLITMVVGRGVAQLLLGGQIVPLAATDYVFTGSGYFLGLPFSITLAVLATIGLTAFCRGTAAGLFIEAFGSSSTASRLAGVRPLAVVLLVYALSGVCAGLAGLVISTNIHAVDVNNLGLFLELDAILAVVIGGTLLTGGRFSTLGSVLGALIIQTVSTTVYSRGIPVEVMLMAKAFVVIAICLLQSERVRGSRWPFGRGARLATPGKGPP